MSYKGYKVKHKLYGEGTVVKENSDFVFVNFKNGKKTQFGNDANLTKYLEFEDIPVVEKVVKTKPKAPVKAPSLELQFNESTKEGVDYLKYWNENRYDEAMQWAKKARALVENFVDEYPMDRILDMSMEEYMIAPKGHGQDKSFCRKIRYDLQPLASMGNAFPSTFGLYMKGGKQITLSPTYEVLFGDDYEKAFEYIKKQIYELLVQGYNDDIQGIANNDTLNNMFKYKLLAIYYPDKYFPVCARDAAYEYVSRLGIATNPGEEMIYSTKAAMKWRDMCPQTSHWNNSILMSFCDWLWVENKAIRGNLYL